MFHWRALNHLFCHFIESYDYSLVARYYAARYYAARRETQCRPFYRVYRVSMNRLPCCVPILAGSRTLLNHPLDKPGSMGFRKLLDDGSKSTLIA